MSDERDPGRQGPVDFAPARIGGPPRRFDPSIAVVLVIALGVAAAILKPWDGGDPAAAGPSSTAVAAAASPEPTGTPGASVRSSAAPDRAGALARAALDAAVPRRERGVRILADSGGAAAGSASAATVSLREAWYPAAEDAALASPVVVTSVSPVRVLGVTASTDRTPLGVRFWRATDDEGWRWLDVPSLASDRPVADLLFAPPRLGGITIPSWPAGRYRLDLLMGTSIERIDVVLEAPAGTDGPLLDLDEATVLGRFDREGQTPALPGRPRFGPYAVASGVHRPLEAAAGPLLDPAAAWLDRGDRVARQVLPGAIALGVTLPSDAVDIAGVIRRLAPDPVFDGPTARVIRGGTAGGGATAGEGAADGDGATDPGAPAVEFVRGAGRAWAPGVYAIEASWRDATGARSTAWHIELLPGSATRPSPLLDAARRYGAQAGREAFVVSRPRRLGMEAGSDAVIAFPLGGDIGCERSRMDDTPIALGLALPDGARLVAVEALRDRVTGGAAAVGVRLVPEAMPGLALLAPRDAPRFRAGIYAFRLHVEGLRGDDRGEATLRTMRICLGPPPFDG